MIAGYQALRNGKTKDQIDEKASALSLSLRTKIARFLAEDKEFQQTWFADAGATVDTEAGNPATTRQEYIETVKRPHKWTDSWMIQAAAVILKTEIHVFKWCSRNPGSSAEWVYLDVCHPNQKSKAVPIVLCLKDGHFTRVEPDSVFPVNVYEEEPLSQQLEKAVSVYRGSGKAKSSCSSWLKSPKSPSVSSKIINGGNSVSSWIKTSPVKSLKSKHPRTTPNCNPPVREDASSVGSWIKPPPSHKPTPKGSCRSNNARKQSPKPCASSSSKGPKEVTRNWPCPVCKTVFTATGPSEEAVTAKLIVIYSNAIKMINFLLVHTPKSASAWSFPRCLRTSQWISANVVPHAPL